MVGTAILTIIGIILGVIVGVLALAGLAAEALVKESWKWFNR